MPKKIVICDRGHSIEETLVEAGVSPREKFLEAVAQQMRSDPENFYSDEEIERAVSKGFFKIEGLNIDVRIIDVEEKICLNGNPRSEEQRVKDYWAEDPNYPSQDWKAEVANDDTRLGYWEWVTHEILKEKETL